jgi:glucokinase
MEPVVCIDIGGTFTRVGIYDGESRSFYVKVDSHGLLDNRFEKLAQILAGRRLGSRAVVAFPSLIPPEHGPITDKNLTFDTDTFASRFGFSRIDVLNDLEAGAYHIATRTEALFGVASRDEDSVLLNEEALSAPGRGVLIVYAGTGLGTSAIIRGHVFASEINRFVWSPKTYAEEAFAQWLEDHGAHAHYLASPDELFTYDYFCSGRVIERYYAFRTGEVLGAAQISERSSYDREAEETLFFFFDQLARYTALSAQAFLTFEGIVLGGNIVRSNRDVLMRSRFLETFTKYAFRKRIARVPIALNLEHDINLKGCARYALHYP